LRQPIAVSVKGIQGIVPRMPQPIEPSTRKHFLNVSLTEGIILNSLRVSLTAFCQPSAVRVSL
jgi:hypothetical protein